MKYAIRTVSWRFKESIELAPEFNGVRNVKVSAPIDIFNNYRSLFTDHVRERFVVFWLSSSNKVLGFEVVTEGLLNSSLVHPREVFEPAVRYLAAQIIVAHNHPSGDPEPSEEDLTITKRLVEAGKILGIELTDHIIVVKDKFISFKDKGLL